MNLPITLLVLLACVGVTAGCGWMGARPKDYSKPRMIPWQLLMLVGAVAVLIVAVHLVNVLGFTTGQGR
jgi:hypothetical protein